jgi:hypothetical protein
MSPSKPSLAPAAKCLLVARFAAANIPRCTLLMYASITKPMECSWGCLGLLVCIFAPHAPCSEGPTRVPYLAMSTRAVDQNCSCTARNA